MNIHSGNNIKAKMLQISIHSYLNVPFCNVSNDITQVISGSGITIQYLSNIQNAFDSISLIFNIAFTWSYKYFVLIKLI